MFLVLSFRQKNGAGDGTRTRDNNVGNVGLYQLSYSRSILLFKGENIRMRAKQVKIFASMAGFFLAGLSLFFQQGCADAPVDRITPRARWHNNQGVVYMDQHNYTRARSEFARSIELVSTYAIGHANLGIAYYSLGKYDSAAVALQAALGHDPSLLQAHYTLGLIYNAQGKEHEKALQALEEVAKIDPDDPQVLYYLGQVKAKLGQSEEAIAALLQAIRMDPYNISAYYALANQYRRLDRKQEWREALQTFNRLSQAGHQGVSSSYQGQGMYAEAVIDASGANAALDDAGPPLTFSADRFADLPTGIRYATAADWDDDGDADLLLLADGLLAYRNDGNPSALGKAVEPALPPELAPVHVLATDYDNDGDADLVLSGRQVLLLTAEAPGQWGSPRLLEQSSRRAFAADVDHDGDLDLLIAADRGSRLWSNDGLGEFTDITEQAGLTAAHSARRAVFSDFDDDRDIDFFILAEEGVQLFTNNRDGTFADVAQSLGLNASGSWSDMEVEDTDQDGFMDLLLLTPGGELSLYANREGRQFALQPSISIPLESASGLATADLDADGDLDLFAFGRGGIRLLTHRKGRFDVDDQVLLEGRGVEYALPLDWDADGRTDLFAAGQLLRNQTAGGSWIRIVAHGQGSNRDAIGAKVEVKTINRLQKQEVRTRGALTFGLAGTDSVEFVRILWPGGVRQTELATRAGQTLSLTELDRKGTSCPIVYAWDGERFRFVSDINGGAIIGYLVAPGQYNTPDTDEYLRLGKIAPKDGYYTLKLANQLEEVIFVDALHLLAVDHSPDVDIFPNERLLTAPPYPEFTIYPLRNLRPLGGAADHHGQNILPHFSRVDDDWYDGFARTDIHGFAEEFSLVLDLGDLSRDPHPVLLAYGWVDYAHSTSNWAAAQRGWSLYPPRVEVPGPDGTWIEVCADMGTPAGLPKHMLFDLQDLFPTTDYRLRITTNTAVYWDQFLVGTRDDGPVHVHRLSPNGGDLSWRGYPEHTAIEETFAFRYHYDRLQQEAPWGTHAGSFTRFGPVGELLDGVDDRFVIMFHGDELTVKFAAAAFPQPAPGLKRSFLLYSDGFGKDMDFHSAHSLTVEPLPFHGMSTYPYPATESYPQTQAHLDYLMEYNTRRVKGYYQ